MNLKVVREREVPEASPAQPTQERARESAASFDPSRLAVMMAMIDEIRRMLNARASVIVALVGAAALTFLAMEKGTGMALAIASSYDLFVFLPLAYIAYLRRKE